MLTLQHLCAQAEAFKGQRVKITISDIVDRANGKCSTAVCELVTEDIWQTLSKLSNITRARTADPKAGSLEPTSPRSVEACLRLGIEPR